MSHASLLVALSPEDVARAGGDIERAVSHQMEPFDENGKWFRKGSRWDWWTIGGRYTGRFAEPGYDPTSDPRNLGTCFLCKGTGKRDDELGYRARQADPNYSCNGCGGKGKSVKFSSEWVPVGNVARRADLSEERLRESARLKAESVWAEWEAEKMKDDFSREEIYGIKAGETRADYVARKSAIVFSCYAFLKDREWNETARLGWFGSSAKTECEIKAEESGEAFSGRCLHKDEATGAKIVSWTGPKDDEEMWARMFWPRFVRRLPDDYTLVVVDYHV